MFGDPEFLEQNCARPAEELAPRPPIYPPAPLFGRFFYRPAGGVVDRSACGRAGARSIGLKEGDRPEIRRSAYQVLTANRSD